MKRKRIENFVMYLNEELGKGSFGKVYKGINEHNKQPVAIKVLAKSLSKRPDYAVDKDDYVKDALVSEIKIMRKLKSEAIVGFVDILETPNNYYVIQELCDGGDLKSLLRKHKPFAEKKSVQFLSEICLGYQQLINNSVIHRDLKPENLLLHGGHLKLADFGFAKYVISHTALQKSIVGTPLYMSPQILKRVKYTSKCDVWSMGVIFYEMLFGCLPWRANSEYELVQTIATVGLMFPSTIEISENSRNFLKGCLTVEESDRFSWLQVYSHPIFEGRFREFTQKNKKLTERAGYVINSLRLEIHSQNIDLEKLFNRMKLSKASHLNKQEFCNLLRTLDPKLEEDELHYVFVEFDADGSGTVDFEEFRRQLEQSGIRMNSVRVCNLAKKHTIDFVEGEENTKPHHSLSPEKKNDRIDQVIVRLRAKIDEHQLDLLTVYRSYDRNHDDTLSLAEFSKLLLKIDSKLNEEELQLCFQKFDSNDDGAISYEEFLRTMSKIAGDPFSIQRKFTE